MPTTRTRPGRWPGSHRPRGPVLVLAVAAGAAVGALLRHAVDLAAPVAGSAFPWPTLAVNVTGAAALAVVGALPGVRRRPVLTAGLGPGVLGGYTTFSTYAEQGRGLLAAGEPGLALGYLLGTLAGCLAVCALVGHLAEAARRSPGDRAA